MHIGLIWSRHAEKVAPLSDSTLVSFFHNYNPHSIMGIRPLVWRNLGNSDTLVCAITRVNIAFTLITLIFGHLLSVIKYNTNLHK